MKLVVRSLLSFFILIAVTAGAQNLPEFEKRVTTKKLANGLTVILCQRPEAPVFSFNIFVDAGDAQDPFGKTGLAHMMEHMAFKGTYNIGTTNWPAEKVTLDQVETTYAAYFRERIKETGRDEKKLQQLENAWKAAVEKANAFVVPNEFPQILERQGAVGVNASTGFDETQYNYSIPTNRAELWAYLESERFLQPVMREFYKERDVVIEERRMRTDSQPIGRLVEQFLGTAFRASAYQRPSIGYFSDLQAFSATDAMAFFKSHYIPSNMTVSIAGDVKPETMMPIIEKYFGRIPSAPTPVEYMTVEPPQNSERRVVMKDPSQPFYVEGYHRPDYRDKDDAVYDAITDLMSSGRTSRLFRALVRDKKIAAFAAGFSGFPGTKYPHLFAFYGVPLPGHTNQEMADAIRVEIERLKTQDVTDDELKMVKTRAKAALIRSLDSNTGLAENLSVNQARYGDWRELFRQVDRIDKVTKEDIRRVANKTFVENNRTVGMIETAASTRKGAK
jgi:predicted Zn-dependent peptidase